MGGKHVSSRKIRDTRHKDAASGTGEEMTARNSGACRSGIYNLAVATSDQGRAGSAAWENCVFMVDVGTSGNDSAMTTFGGRCPDG